MFITITGKPCSGKSTIANLLVDNHGFKKISVGDIFKEEAHKRGMSAEEFNKFCMQDPSFDYFIDNKTVEYSKKFEGQKIIFDSRMAWHFVPKSFKIFVDLNEDEMAKRLVNSNRKGKEKYADLESAKQTLLSRESLEIERYKKIYNQDLSNMDNFDLVLDSSNKTPQELADVVWSEYKKFCEKIWL